MEPDIKVGETYNVRVKVKEKGDISGKVVTIGPGGEELLTHYFFLSETRAFSHINPYPPLNLPKMTEIPETAPKYAPCRLFREGDEVRVVEKYGRTVHDPLNGGIWKVARNERTGGAHEMSVLVHLFYEDKEIARQISVPFCFLELVTPVEEREPYSVEEAPTHWDVAADKGMKTVAMYSKGYHPNAKAAAEAECKRLNEEYRKEQK